MDSFDQRRNVVHGFCGVRFDGELREPWRNTGHPQNEECDRLASMAATKLLDQVQNEHAAVAATAVE